MIVEAIIGGITAIVRSSLYVANAIDKRMYDDDDDGSFDENDGGTKVYPFNKTETCPLCGLKRKPKHWDGTNWIEHSGPLKPISCNGSCETKKPHLHVECITCKTKYLVAAANPK